MSYTALYRKFRPKGFEDVKGQEHIVTTLKNQIEADRIGHAYLFCGTRGTGKTTVAKILAKAVNCEHPIDGSPCNECKICQSINNQTSMNVIEIDAASNNGVDNIREIVEEVQYSPTEGKYKVYIIDEVHMLSTGAFNALLKTLEEPPSYVIFILATTEVHKIPITILSRCQRYDFKRISIDVIADRLKELVQKENVTAEEKAIRYVAKAADGSMRDALSLLDQCIAFYLGQELTYDRVLEVLGAVDTEIFGQMFQYINTGQVVPALELLERLVMEGRELSQFIIDFTWYLRNLLLIKTSEEADDIVDASTEQLKQLVHEAKLAESETLMRYIRVLSELSNQIKYATQKRVLVEIGIIKLCKPSMETNYDSILDRIRVLEKALEEGRIPIAKEPIMTPVAVEKEEGEQIEETPLYPLAIPEELRSLAENWHAILGRLPGAVRSMMGSAIPTAGEGSTLLLMFRDELEKNFIDSGTHVEDIKQAIRECIQKEVAVETRYISEQQESADSGIDLTKIIKMKIEYED
ncbi:DNA polymerase III subunit gamma/tau [Velocimicrobium porci]|uniref:DNA-directed DNA polymerase n=1 Tax=Velocimicrobium porci TaxID=2606634 RepID=A0A6L5Y098_9FIRM|nr:DNA polymerase III subunit gamma/tau [Velocimicrobium porci]MSS64556.1 DNA polymerase III subunit gamma/tau [Velocimicrobium porci]